MDSPCTISRQLDRGRDEFFNFNRGFEIHVIIVKKTMSLFISEIHEYYIFPESI
jgi:hypothetical protein